MEKMVNETVSGSDMMKDKNNIKLINRLSINTRAGDSKHANRKLIYERGEVLSQNNWKLNGLERLLLNTLHRLFLLINR